MSHTAICVLILLYNAELHAYIQWLVDHSKLPKPGNITNATEAEEEEKKEEEEEVDEGEKRMWPELPTFGKEHKYVPATQVCYKCVLILLALPYMPPRATINVSSYKFGKFGKEHPNFFFFGRRPEGPRAAIQLIKHSFLPRAINRPPPNSIRRSE